MSIIVLTFKKYLVVKILCVITNMGKTTNPSLISIPIFRIDDDEFFFYKTMGELAKKG
jgi:hypothetical protein